MWEGLGTGHCLKEIKSTAYVLYYGTEGVVVITFGSDYHVLNVKVDPSFFCIWEVLQDVHTSPSNCQLWF